MSEFAQGVVVGLIILGLIVIGQCLWWHGRRVGRGGH
jgi:hypothetical protein